MRLSLKELFGLVAYCAVLAWFGAFFGFKSDFFWVSIGLIAVLSVLFVWLASADNRRVAAPWVSGIFLLLGMCLASLALFADAVLLIVAGVYFAFRPALRVKTLTVVAMVCSLVAFAVAAVPGISYGRKLVEMREQFPIEDLPSRLNYETPGSADDVVLSNDVSQRLDLEESHSEAVGNFRGHSLRLVHDREYERFTRTTGFGIGRMVPRPSIRRLSETPLADIQFGAAPVELAGTGDRDWRMAYDFEKVTEVDELHTASRRDFVHPDGFGAVVEPRERVIGFIEHGFHYPMSSFIAQPEVWTLERLELVSLLKFEGPRVYVLDHLPRMDQLQGLDVPTRELDDFETESLKKLWTQEDVVIEEVDDQVRMLGSLRATRQCLDCHSVERGTLLGAFSYVLTREGIAEVADSNGKHDPSEP